MSFSDAELEVQLKDAANGLLDPPSSTEELLSLLDVMFPSFALHKDIVFWVLLVFW